MELETAGHKKSAVAHASSSASEIMRGPSARSSRCRSESGVFVNAAIGATAVIDASETLALNAQSQLKVLLSTGRQMSGHPYSCQYLTTPMSRMNDLNSGSWRISFSCGSQR